MSYLSYGVSTTSRSLYETPSVFPKITICNANPFTTRYAINFLKEFNKEVNLYIDIFNEEQMNRMDFYSKFDFLRVFNIKAIYKMNGLNETEEKTFTFLRRYFSANYMSI